jgi:hypothetical protein
MREEKLIEVLHDRVRVLFGEGAKAREKLQILFAELEKGSAALDLRFVEFQHLHVPAVIHGRSLLHASRRRRALATRD